MSNLNKTNYLALKKCVLNDYPYEIEWDDKIVTPIFEEVHDSILEQHANINEKYYSNNGKGTISLNYLDHYVILAYRLAHTLWKSGYSFLSDAIYYSMRVRGGIDLYYTTELGPYFMPAHSLGTCMDAHAKYGKLLQIYNGCHLGPYNIVGKDPKDWKHPILGDYVTMLSGSRIYGDSIIGNNVLLSVNTVVINEEIPDNCIVSGISPNLVFQRLRIPNSSMLLNV